MPRRTSDTRRTRTVRRGRGPKLDLLKKWASMGHRKIRSVNGYSRAGTHLHGKAKPHLDKALKNNPWAKDLVNRGISSALTKLKQKGYHGLNRTGQGLKRAGSGKCRCR